MDNGNSNNVNKDGGNKKVSVSITTIALVVIIFIILIVVAVIAIVKGNSNQSNQNASVAGNETNSSSQINAIDNTTNEFTNNYLNETNNTIHNDNNNVNDTNTIGSDRNEEQIEKLNISDENLVNILAETEDFRDGSKLSMETYVAIVYKALNEGYIVLDKNRSNESGKSTVEYSTDEINKIVYSIFGVKLSEYKNYGEVFVYKDGKYVLQFSDGGTGSFEIKNLETDVAAGTEYLTYDLYYKDEMGEDFRGNYSIGINNQTHFVSTKRKM